MPTPRSIRVPAPWLAIALGALLLAPTSLRAEDAPALGLDIRVVLPTPAAEAEGRSAPWRLGHAHGALLRVEIRKLLGLALPAMVDQVLAGPAGQALQEDAGEAGVPAKALVLPALIAQAQRIRPHIPEALQEEMAGIAEGAGVPPDHILLANTFLTLSEQTDPAALLRMPVRCTNAVALGRATSMGHLVHGTTLDWGMGPILKSRSVALLQIPETGHPFLAITWPGLVGTLRVLGAQGLSLSEASSAAPDDTQVEGVPIGMRMRLAVQHADTLQEAVNRLREGPGTCGYRVTVASGVDLDARVVELTATRAQVRRPQGGVLLGCDPTAPDTAFVGPRDAAIPRGTGSSVARTEALRTALAAVHGRVRSGTLEALLGNRDHGILRDDTLHACVFEPLTLQLHVAMGANVAQGLTWRSASLLEHLPAPVRARYAPPLPQRIRDATAKVQVKRTMTLPGKIQRIEIGFPSTLPLGQAQADEVHAELFLPENPCGVVIEIPAWKESTLAGHRFLAVGLARQNVATLVLPLPGQAKRIPEGMRSGQWTLSADLARTRRVFTQGLADILQVSRWLESAHGFGPDRQAVSGVSLGGHAAALALGALPDRFRAGVFILAGANVHEAFLTHNPITGRIQRQIEAKGVTHEEARPLLAWMEPSEVADKARAADVLLIAADADEVVFPRNAKALAAAWGDAEVIWLSGGHYAILGGLPKVIGGMARHLTAAFKR